MRHTSYIEISESAVENNLKFIRELVGEQVVFSSVVKGNAYGHGTDIYCPIAYKYGQRHFSVADASEAYEVRRILCDGNVNLMIMGWIDCEELEWAVEQNVSFYVFEKQRLQQAIAAARKVGKPARIHVELETGMNRTGFEESEYPFLEEQLLAAAPHLVIEGLCTHLAGAESISNYKRIMDQQAKFKADVRRLAQNGVRAERLHMASSAATIRYPESRYDLVRVGILQYGFFPTQETWVHYLNEQHRVHDPLRRIVSWKTKVMDIKTVSRGQFVGYGTSYFANKSTRIAVIPVGYSSGYSRSLSNQGKVIIRGKRLDVIGTVNMNMMAVDISNVASVEIGDEVVLIGRQGELEISVASFSDFSQLINYELLTRLPQNIPRIVTP